MTMQTSRMLLSSAAALVAIVGISAQTSADDATDITVAVDVIDACEFGTVTDVTFADYFPGQTTPLSQSGSMEITCSNPDDVFVTLSGGNPVSGNTRQMDDGSGNFLNYELFDPNGGAWSIAPYAQNFGIGTLALNFTADLPANQIAPSGSYSETVTLTMTF